MTTEEVQHDKRHSNYSRIPVIQYPQNQTGARRSNIQGYQTVPIPTYNIPLYSLNNSRHHFTTKIQLSNATMLFKIFAVSSQRMCTFQTSLFHHKNPSFINYHTPSHRVSSRMHCCKTLTQHLVQLCSFRMFQCSLLKKFLQTFT
jgi:hypothetical protein